MIGSAGGRRSGLVAACVALAASLVATGCSGRDGAATRRAGDATIATPASAGAATSTTADPTVDPAAALRLDLSPVHPRFLYNVYVGADPGQMAQVVDLWPEDLRQVLAFQLVFPAKPPLPEVERVAAMEPFLAEADRLGVATLVQTVAFTGRTGPSDAELDAAFDAHRSLAGVAAAELSADYATSVGGLSDTQKDLLAGQIDVAARHDATFLWADMGYFGPQVFVDAGADARLADTLRRHHRNVVIQVKQNGAGRHFGTWSAAAGLVAAGFADHWGVNSEDWLWWESSFEGLFAAPVPGGLGVTGMARSDRPNLARLTYPESLFGTEMLVAAASGATVFSIEAPARGSVDPAHRAVSPAGEQVVFPLLRRLADRRLIPSRAQVAARQRFALQPAGRDVASLRTDAAYDGIGGPEGCTTDDRIVCTQRQWLPSTGRFGLVPTLPALAGDEVHDRFDEVLMLDDATTAEQVRVAAERHVVSAAAAQGDSWVGPSARDDVWFVANPNENVDVTTTFEHGDVGGRLPPHTFAIVDEGRDTVFVDRFHTDTSPLWAEPATPGADDALATAPLDDVPAAPPRTVVVRFRGVTGRAVVRPAGGTLVDAAQRRRDGWLEVSVTHAGPVVIGVR